MEAFKLAKKYPELGQQRIFELQVAFNQIKDEDKGSAESAAAIKAAQGLENKDYDEVRAALKTVELDSSGRVELEDFVDVSVHS